MRTGRAGLAVAPAATADDVPLHHVRYTVSSDTRSPPISTTGRPIPDWGVYSHDPYVWSPRADAPTGPGPAAVGVRHHAGQPQRMGHGRRTGEQQRDQRAAHHQPGFRCTLEGRRHGRRRTRAAAGHCARSGRGERSANGRQTQGPRWRSPVWASPPFWSRRPRMPTIRCHGRPPRPTRTPRSRTCATTRSARPDHTERRPRRAVRRHLLLRVPGPPSPGPRSSPAGSCSAGPHAVMRRDTSAPCRWWASKELRHLVHGAGELHGSGPGRTVPDPCPRTATRCGCAGTPDDGRGRKPRPARPTSPPPRPRPPRPTPAPRRRAPGRTRQSHRSAATAAEPPLDSTPAPATGRAAPVRYVRRMAGPVAGPGRGGRARPCSASARTSFAVTAPWKRPAARRTVLGGRPPGCGQHDGDQLQHRAGRRPAGAGQRHRPIQEDFESTSKDLVKALQEGKILTEVDVKSVAVQSMTNESAVVLVSAVSQRGDPGDRSRPQGPGAPWSP